MGKTILKKIAAWLLAFCTVFCYVPTSVFADEDVTYGSTGDTVKDVNYRTILGDAVNYGVVADTFVHQNHTQTNFAVNEYVREGEQILEADLMGEGNIPFIIGEMSNKIRFGQHTFNNANVTMDIVTNEKYKGDDSLFIRDNKDRVAVNATYESEASIRNKVSALQQHAAEWSEKLAAKEPTVTLSKTMRGNTIDVTRYDADAVIYVSVPEDGNFLTEVVNHSLTIKKKSNQIVVFNIPNKNISLREFTVVADGETVRSQTSQSNTNQKADEEILRKVIWNMPNAENVNLKDNVGMFLVPKETATVNLDGGAVGGWMVTGGTLKGHAEWHFMFQGRNNSNKPNNKPDAPAMKDANGSIILQGTKKLEGRDFQKGDSWNFTLKPVTENAPMPDNTTVAIHPEKDNSVAFAFDEISFTKSDLNGLKEKQFTYEIAENGQVQNVINDSAKHTVTVTVKDDGTDKLDVQAKYSDGDSAKFVNTFTIAPASTVITGIKQLSGRNMQKEEQFRFALEAGDEATRKAIADKDVLLAEDSARLNGLANGEQATISFGEAKFYKEGEYTFRVKEERGDKAGMAYDTEEKNLKVKVTRENGALKAVQEETPTFTNTYEAKGELALEGTKILLSGKENKLTVKDGQFRFSVYYAGHEDMDPVTTGTTGSGKEAEIHFGKITYTISKLEKMVQDGYANKVEIDGGARYVINYVVTEDPADNDAMQQNTEAKGVQVFVEDNGDGTLSVESEGADHLDFENRYKSGEANVALEGLKVLKGRSLQAEEFTFTLTSEDADAPMPEKTEVKNDAKGQINFGTITFDKDDLGDETEKTFIYKIQESGNQPGVANDTEVKTVKVTVKDDGTGKISATTETTDAPLFTFTNTYRTDKVKSSVTDWIKIRKKLTGRTLKEDEFTFILKDEDGKTVGKATNDSEGNILFDKLTFEKAGTYNYKIMEEKGDDKNITYDSASYQVTAVVTDKQDGTLSVKWNYGDNKTVQFRNTYTKQGKKTTPDTGDTSEMPLYAILLIMGIAGLGTVGLYRRKMNR